MVFAHGMTFLGEVGNKGRIQLVPIYNRAKNVWNGFYTNKHKFSQQKKHS